MPDFSSIEKVLFPHEVLKQAFDFMRSTGKKGFEAVTLFVGKRYEGIFQITEVYIPVQESYKTEHGLVYQVSSHELSKLDDWLLDKKLTLFCQMHTQPREAYHSATDDRNCIVTAAGAMSIVIPDFGKRGIDINTWAVYRLMRECGWTELDPAEVHATIEIR